MNSIAQLDAAQPGTRTRVTGRTRYPKLARTAALAAMLLLAIVTGRWFASRPSPAFAALTQAAEYVRGKDTIHISARMRAIPKDNFDYIDLSAPLIPIEMWKDRGDPPKIRIEKQGRQIAADGKTTTMLIQSAADSYVVKHNGLAEGLFPTLAPFLNADMLFQREGKAVDDPGSDVSMKSGVGPDGRKKIVLTISAKAKGNFSESDYAKNKSIVESDNIRTYVFDAASSKCESIKVQVRTDRGNVLVFETTKIEYGAPLDQSLFHLDIPKTAVVLNEAVESGIDTAWMQPDEFVRQFFEALSRSDWQAARALGGARFDSPADHTRYGGLRIISLGKPVQSGLYRGWFVPYEIQLASGDIVRHRIAVRNDNPAHEWKVDGGF